ncbi:MAG: GLPGLI family protein [Bacteroidales bacterium]|jgi:GLPGLI family protein|nr:GLPGLI family protein [Bacteroidales bacterium]MCI1733185.1 GLPGLI family protein [Bacteroidales bacterium]
MKSFIKKTFVCVFVGSLCIVNNAEAQFPPLFRPVDKYKVEDACLYNAYYDLVFYPYGKEKSVIVGGVKHQEEHDITLVQIGKNVMHSFSYEQFKNDSLNTILAAKGRNTYSMKQEVFQSNVYRYLKESKITLIYRTILFGPIYSYTEQEIPIKWEISSDKDTLSNYLCQKATCTFLGRHYTAWFTSDIPFSAGPYKFGGLPGLIVKIADETNDYEWSLRSFTRAASDETIKLYKWPYQSITRAKMADIVRRMNNNPYMFLESIGAKFHVGNSDSYSYISLPYNPIELDLEQKNK